MMLGYFANYTMTKVLCRSVLRRFVQFIILSPTSVRAVKACSRTWKGSSLFNVSHASKVTRSIIKYSNSNRIILDIDVSWCKLNIQIENWQVVTYLEDPLAPEMSWLAMLALKKAQARWDQHWPGWRPVANSSMISFENTATNMF